MRSGRRRRRTLLRAVLAFTVVLASVAGYLCVRPIPPPILRWVIVRSAPSLLTDHALDPPGRLSWATRAAHRAWANLLSFSLARAYDAAVPVDPAAGDVAYLIERLSPLRRLLVSQNEITHPAHDWFGFFSGLGYCDQLNRVGALVLAERFRRVQTFTLSSPDGSAGHVIGRVWSDEVGGWIYFDLWPVNLAVFRFDGGVKPLGGTCDVPDSAAPPEDAFAARLYPQVPFGTVLNEYPPTFGAYLWSRLRASHAIGASVAAEYPRAAPSADSSSSAVTSTLASAAVAVPAQGAAATSAAGLVVTAEVARAFMAERLERLFATGARIPRVPSTSTASEDDRLLISVSRLVARKLTTPAASCVGSQSGQAAPTTATHEGG